MSGTIVGSGRCLCNAVHLKAESMQIEVIACHCKTCRKWGGGPLFSVDCGTSITIEGVENVAVYDSSPWAERGFCKQCGTHLFYRIKQTQQHIVPVGLFEDNAQLIFDRQVFIDQKPAFYHFGNQTDKLTGAEVFAKFAPPAD